MWYTRSGDAGYTGVLGEGRVPKDAQRIEALGDLDEATSCIGLARAQVTHAEFVPTLIRIQQQIVQVLAEVAAPDPRVLSARLEDTAVTELEADIHALSARIEMPKVFVLPGQTRSGAAFDVARAVVRRAERHVVTLVLNQEVHNDHLLPFLNRLSSVLYLMARIEDAGVTEVGG
jgi:cob(I)alamin adenosyltransferase